MGFNQTEYIKKYNKNIYKMYPIRIRKDNVKIMDKLNSVSSVNKYINELIEKDINPSGILTIKQIKEKILPVLRNHGINKVYLFGSYARGEATINSDVDIYCKSGDILSLTDHVRLEDELTKALGKDVDVIFIGSKMHYFFKEQLDKDKILLC